MKKKYPYILYTHKDGKPTVTVNELPFINRHENVPDFVYEVWLNDLSEGANMAFDVWLMDGIQVTCIEIINSRVVFVNKQTEMSDPIRYPLFKHMMDEHGAALLDSEIDEIINIVNKQPGQGDKEWPEIIAGKLLAKMKSRNASQEILYEQNDVYRAILEAASSSNMENIKRKKITVALLRDLEFQVSKGEITYSKMVDILNQPQHHDNRNEK